MKSPYLYLKKSLVALLLLLAATSLMAQNVINVPGQAAGIREAFDLIVANPETYLPEISVVIRVQGDGYTVGYDPAGSAVQNYLSPAQVRIIDRYYDITIEGDGPDKTVIKGFASLEEMPEIRFGGHHNIGMRFLQIGSAGGAGMKLTLKNIKLQNWGFGNFDGGVINMNRESSNGWQLRMVNVEFEHMIGRAGAIVQSDQPNNDLHINNIFVHNCVMFDNNAFQGLFQLYRIRNLSVKNSTFMSNERYAVNIGNDRSEALYQWHYQQGAQLIRETPPIHFLEAFKDENLPLWPTASKRINSYVFTINGLNHLSDNSTTKAAENFRVWLSARNNPVLINSGLIMRYFWESPNEWGIPRIAANGTNDIVNVVKNARVNKITFGFQSILSKDFVGDPTFEQRIAVIDMVIDRVEKNLQENHPEIWDDLDLEWALIDALVPRDRDYIGAYTLLRDVMVANNRKLKTIYLDYPWPHMVRQGGIEFLEQVATQTASLGYEVGLWISSGPANDTPIKYKAAMNSFAQAMKDHGPVANLSRIVQSDFQFAVRKEFPDAVVDDGIVHYMEVFNRMYNTIEFGAGHVLTRNIGTIFWVRAGNQADENRTVLFENNAFVNNMPVEQTSWATIVPGDLTINPVSTETAQPVISFQHQGAAEVTTLMNVTMRNNIMIENRRAGDNVDTDIAILDPLSNERVVLHYPEQGNYNIVNAVARNAKYMETAAFPYWRFENVAFDGFKISPEFTYNHPGIAFEMEDDLPKVFYDEFGVGYVKYIGDGGTPGNPVTSITLSAPSAFVAPGLTLQINVTVVPADATDTSVTWSVDGGTGIALVDQTGLLTGVSNGAVSVVATANDGSGVAGNLVVTVGNYTSVTDPFAARFTVYPNPIRETMHIVSDVVMDEIRLINVIGQLVYTASLDNKNHQLPVGDIKEGVYLVQIVAGDTVLSKRVIISR